MYTSIETLSSDINIGCNTIIRLKDKNGIKATTSGTFGPYSYQASVYVDSLIDTIDGYTYVSLIPIARNTSNFGRIPVASYRQNSGHQIFILSANNTDVFYLQLLMIYNKNS